MGVLQEFDFLRCRILSLLEMNALLNRNRTCNEYEYIIKIQRENYIENLSVQKPLSTGAILLVLKINRCFSLLLVLPLTLRI